MSRRSEGEKTSSSEPISSALTSSEPVTEVPVSAVPSGAPSARASVGRAIVRGATIILLVTVIARIAGFVRYLVFGASVGAGEVGTAYASANLVPNLLFEVAAGGALAASVVPLVAGLMGPGTSEDSRDRAQRIIAALLGWTLLITVPLAALVALAAQPLSAMILGAPGTGDEAITALGARMLRIFALQLPFYGITVVLAAFLQARKRFLWPALAPLLSSLVVIAVYRVYAAVVPAVATARLISPLAESLLSWGTTLAVVVMAASLVVPARRAGLRLRPALRMPPGEGKRALALAAAGLGSVGAQQLALALVLLQSMRTGGTGTLPVFQYAQAVYLLPCAVLAIPLITSVFPHLAEQRLIGDTAAFERTAAASLRALAVIGAIGGAALFAAGPALEAFFHSIDRAGATGVGAAVAALSLGLLPYVLTLQCTRILSAALRARDAALVGSIGWIVGALGILMVSVLSTSSSSAQAATAFGFALSLGMWVSAITGLARAGDLIESRSLRRPVHRAAVIGALAALVGGIAGMILGRALVHQGLGEISTVLLGLLTGALGALLALGIMALVDPAAARQVLAAGRRSRSAAAA